ncbi:Na+/H+ antiporter NhaC family protein, partial [Escherichia coli]|uniref:Na+/H+ antiporter NhaC family protein n=1 Tax=Escherichia coli TaxID=562 RepID=UPI0024C1CE46
MWFQMDIGQMRKHEIAASQGRGFDEAPSTDTQEAHELNEELDIRESERGTVLDLVLPIVFLVVATFGAMIWTGASALAESGQSFDIFGAFEYTNVGTSLVYGGLVGLAMAFVTVLRQKLPTAEIAKTLW